MSPTSVTETSALPVCQMGRPAPWESSIRPVVVVPAEQWGGSVDGLEGVSPSRQAAEGGRSGHLAFP